jgi:hypothetical protein
MPDENKTPEEIQQLETNDAEWRQTLSRLGLMEPDVTQVRNTDILYLAKQWPFLQLLESSGVREHLEKPELLEAKSGWTIINYGDAMATSPGKYIFRGGYYQWTTNAEDEGDGGIVNPHRGTIVKQAFDSVVEMIGLAQEQGWAGVMIVDGHPDMQRAAWVEGCRVGMRIDGYTPDIEAEKQRRRIVSQSLDEMHAALKGLK